MCTEISKTYKLSLNNCCHFIDSNQRNRITNFEDFFSQPRKWQRPRERESKTIPRLFLILNRRTINLLINCGHRQEMLCAKNLKTSTVSAVKNGGLRSSKILSPIKAIKTMAKMVRINFFRTPKINYKFTATQRALIKENWMTLGLFISIPPSPVQRWP